jgi:hypothetical protein
LTVSKPSSSAQSALADVEQRIVAAAREREAAADVASTQAPTARA